MNRARSRREPSDLVLVGGGLQNCLIALAVLESRPAAKITIVERADGLGGNHTWSFHSRDVPEGARDLIEPLVAARWGGYDVAFPGYVRSLELPYASVTSGRLHRVVLERLARNPANEVLFGAEVVSVEPSAVVLGSGERVHGALIVDSRGPLHGRSSRSACGYQKFVGLELLLSEPTSRTRPLLMDARVPQSDGFRFFYVLPFDARRILVEDTYFSDTPELDVVARELDVLGYAQTAGMRIEHVARREHGVLPMPTTFAAPVRAGSPLVGGYAGGWFHPATGYSFPVALRLALHVGRHGASDMFGVDWERLVSQHRAQARFATWLNRLLFGAFLPETRSGALERFYRTNEGTIERFYSLDTNHLDRMRLVCGRPPRGLALSKITRMVS